MSEKSISTQRPLRSPSLRTGLTPSSRSLSSMLSTIALTWRSLGADARTKMSVSASCSLTSRATILVASLSSAAAAAALARSMACCVAATRSSWGLVLSVSGPAGTWFCSAGVSIPARMWPVELMFGDVLHDSVRHEVPDRFALDDAGATVGGADGHGGDLLQRHPVRGQTDVAEDMSGTGHADEVGKVPQLIDVFPRQDLGQCIGSGDEEQLRVRALCVQVAQGVDRVGRAFPVDVDAADREARVGRCGDDRHQIAVLGRGHHARALLPWLTGRGEHHLIEVEQGLDLAGGHEVTMMDGIERPTHDADAPGQWCAPGSGLSYLAAVLRKDHSTPRSTMKHPKAMTPKAHGGIGSSRTTVSAVASVATVDVNNMSTA